MNREPDANLTLMGILVINEDLKDLAEAAHYNPFDLDLYCL